MDIFIELCPCSISNNSTDTIAWVLVAHPKPLSKEIMTLLRCEEAALKYTASTFETLKRLLLKRKEGVKSLFFSVAFAH